MQGVVTMYLSLSSVAAAAIGFYTGKSFTTNALKIGMRRRYKHGRGERRLVKKHR